jgi:hypothetical protein
VKQITVLLAFLIGCAASHTDDADANADADWACWTLAPYDCHGLLDPSTCPEVLEALCSSGRFLERCEIPPPVDSILACDAAMAEVHPLPAGTHMCTVPECDICPGWCPD